MVVIITIKVMVEGKRSKNSNVMEVERKYILITTVVVAIIRLLGR